VGVPEMVVCGTWLTFFTVKQPFSENIKSKIEPLEIVLKIGNK
jgi:hypothetical protein